MTINPLFDPATDNQEIDATTQKMINTDQEADDYDPEDQIFVELILKLVAEGKINLYVPSSLLNEPVYEGLAPEGKGLADQNAMAMLPKIRQIVDLSKIYEHPTFQMKSLVASLRLNKENLEKHSGDIFII